MQWAAPLARDAPSADRPGLAPRSLRERPSHSWPRWARLVGNVLHRLLDVLFQYLAPLAGALLLLPALVFGAGLVLDRSQVVTARLWADEPAVLSDSPYAGLT